MAHEAGHIDYISQIQQAIQNQLSGGQQQNNQQQNFGGQTSQYQSPMDALNSMFSPFGVSSDDLTKYSGFIGDIPEELYGLTDPNADIYKQFRSERQERLSDQLGEAYSGLQQSLFTSSREARGMQGRSGFVSGRNMQSDMSKAASMQGEKLGSSFTRGLYDIEESIVDKVGAERKYLATLESQRRSDALKLAGLAGLFDDNEEELDNNAPLNNLPIGGNTSFSNILGGYDFNFSFPTGGYDNDEGDTV
tara:strand:+ start:120 stop:866 length:747 start_codon:yes stop_codon:yes gene_type:complete